MSFSSIGMPMSFKMFPAALALLETITQNLRLPVANSQSTAISTADVLPVPRGSSMLYGRDYDNANCISFKASTNFSDGGVSTISPMKYVVMKSTSDLLARSLRSQFMFSNAALSYASIDEALS